MQCASPSSIFDCRSRPRIHAHCIWGSQDERETIVASRVDALRVVAAEGTHGQPESRKRVESASRSRTLFAPFGVAYEKIGTIQRRLAWLLHKDDTLSRSGRPTGLNIYFVGRSLGELRCSTRSDPVVFYFGFDSSRADASLRHCACSL